MRNETLIVYAADSYGNDINFVEVWQYNETAWNLLANFTTTGGSVRVHDSWVMNFTVGIKVNSTLVSSSAEAISYTRVYMNITDGGTIWNNVELNNTACSLVGSYYYLTEQGHWNATGKPSAGVTYACSILYQAYY
jgi:glycerol-3-phosphate dehydrogenase